jgi:hemin uptake protein HemP
MTERRARPRMNDVSFASAKEKGAIVAAPSPREDRAPVDVRALLDGAREAILVLDGEAYRLRITAKEKLILTK